ncbi:MAG TPA: hypothetical protein VN578_18665 [Candidatus Binatia bacterium]|jgi:hypothetical protein|nr:hypothetical protein [Candidatus Binatia bacterium]
MGILLKFRVWSLKFLWCLVFGFWCFFACVWCFSPCINWRKNARLKANAPNVIVALTVTDWTKHLAVET